MVSGQHMSRQLSGVVLTHVGEILDELGLVGRIHDLVELDVSLELSSDGRGELKVLSGSAPPTTCKGYRDTHGVLLDKAEILEGARELVLCLGLGIGRRRASKLQRCRSRLGHGLDGYRCHCVCVLLCVRTRVGVQMW